MRRDLIYLNDNSIEQKRCRRKKNFSKLNIKFFCLMSYLTHSSPHSSSLSFSLLPHDMARNFQKKEVSQL